MKKTTCTIIILLVLLLLISNISVAVRQGNLGEIQDKLNSLSKDDKDVLETLFSQVQEIEELERKSDRLGLEINQSQGEIELLEKKIRRGEISYERNLSGLEKVLKSYQKMGSASYLEVIFESDSLNDLISRVNILRDLSRNSRDLLGEIEEDQKKLNREKQDLKREVGSLEENRLGIESALDEKMELIEEKEEYLDSLEDKELFIERLKYVSSIMDELKNILNEFTREFDKVIKGGGFPRDAVDESITLKGIRGRISQGKFNGIIKSHENLPQMEFNFNREEISMNVPEMDLYLSGEFVIEGDTVLKFKPEEGDFLDMPLRKSTMDELFLEGNFILDLEPLIGNVKIKTVEVKDGYIEIIVNIF